MGKKAKIGLVVGGTLLAGGVIYAVVEETAPKKRRKRKKLPPDDRGEPPLQTGQQSPPPPFPGLSGTRRRPVPGLTPAQAQPGVPLTPLTPVTAQARLEEPEGGWLARWNQVKDIAIPSCRASVGREEFPSWGTYWRCLAAQAFPEPAPRLPFEAWPSWLREEASAKIQEDVQAYLQAQGIRLEGWTFMLWLRFDAVIDGCYEALAPHTDEIALCVCSEIYPNLEWPLTDSSPDWMYEMWDEVLALIDLYIDREPGVGPTDGRDFDF